MRLVGCSPCGGEASLSKLTKREDRENHLCCDCCYSGKGATSVVWNLIGMCERAAPRRRWWQEMREARWVCARGGSIHSYFLIRETGAGETKSEEEEKKRVPHRHTHGTSDKDADSPRGQHPNPSRKGSWHASRVHQARFHFPILLLGATIQLTIAKGVGPTQWSEVRLSSHRLQ